MGGSVPRTTDIPFHLFLECCLYVPHPSLLKDGIIQFLTVIALAVGCMGV